MSDKKLPSQINIEELLDIAQEETQEPVIINVSDVVRFMLINKLSPGAYPVKTKLLYRLYTHWSKDPITSGSFSLELYRYLPNGQINGVGHCYINESSFKLAEMAESLKDDRKIDKTKSKRSQKHFESFLAHYKLSAGKTFVPYQGLWHLYDKWSHKIAKKHPFGYQSLAQMCALYFVKKRVGVDRGAWYGVSDNIKDHITKQQLEEIKHGQKRLRKKAIKSTKKNKEKGQK